METEILKKLSELEAKIDATARSVEKMRRYFLWRSIITIALIVIPLIGLAFIIPSFIKTFSSLGNLGL